ncbi:hypothetical protein [Acidovorax sp.]|uniref:hypothetical protein n=1 Tax=Acidovorax sp. TaxID=1872122 RepID=UPI002ACE70C3|nr:hypothetical protein [Acidovorax sp.]MDZ7862655.1 hypothetical protein [Acidovorax sp.]
MTDSDAERFEGTPAGAFDLVALELAMPTRKALDELRHAFLSIYGEGHDKAVRMLEGHWPDGAHWQRGEAYLRTLGWRSADEFVGVDEAQAEWMDAYDGPTLLELLFQRLMHLTHRMFRDPQVLGLLSHRYPSGDVVYSHLHLNRNAGWRGDPCGIGIDRIVPVEEGMVHLQNPAHAHPACRCTIDPVEARLMMRSKARSACPSDE